MVEEAGRLRDNEFACSHGDKGSVEGQNQESDNRIIQELQDYFLLRGVELAEVLLMLEECRRLDA